MEQTAESYSIGVPETVLGVMQERRDPIFLRGHKCLYAIAAQASHVSTHTAAARADATATPTPSW
jgi:hypothetical protein